MKIISCIVLSLMFWVTISSAQVEQGDSEIRFLGFYSQMVGTENEFGGSGSVQLSYGYFLTPFLQIGVGPQISFSEGADAGSTEASFSGSAFFNFNFSTTSKTIPYVSGQWYQMDFSPEFGDFTDYSFINVGFGVRNFFTEFAALNTAINYGFSLAEQAEGGLLMIMTGLSVIF